MSTSSILKLANSISKKIDGKDELLISKVSKDIQSVAEENSGDIFLRTYSDVIEKMASNRTYITKKEIGDIYNKLYNFGAKNSCFKTSFAHFLPEEFHYNHTKELKDFKRIDLAKKLEPTEFSSMKPAADAFSELFSLSGNQSVGHTDNTVFKRASNMTSLQLKSMGCPPDKVSVVKTNDNFALCKADFYMPNHKTSSLMIPVDITDNVVKEPTAFISNSKLEKLSKMNVLTSLKIQSNDSSLSSLSKFSEQRRSDSLRMDKAVMPSSLESFSNFEDELVKSFSNFSENEINMARDVAKVKLSDHGINSSLKIHSSDNSKVLFKLSSIKSTSGHDVLVPVEISGGTPSYPRNIIISNAKETKILDLNKNTLSEILHKSSENQISRDYKRNSLKSFHELKDDVLTGVSSGNYRFSEDALSVIQEKFGSDQYIKCLSYFNELLLAKSQQGVDSDLVKSAIKAGKLIKVPTSTEYYSPELGLPLSKLSFDKKGRLQPKRNEKYENISNSSQMVTSKIIIS